MHQAKKITIFLADGLPKGIREVKIDQWSGKAICGPRSRIDDLLLMPELKEGASLYFLVGEPDEGGLLIVYVGEADGFKQRIKQHDSKKDWWQNVVAFVSPNGSLTKTGIKYLESVCIDRLRKIGKCQVDNSNTPNIPTTPKEDASGLEIFYENISLIMPLLGYDIFIPTAIGREDKMTDAQFVCKKGNNVEAQGVLLPDGKMRVLKGSTAVNNNAPSFEKHNYKRLKDELLNMGRLVKNNNKLVFTDNYTFDSPSAAAAVVLARSASGPKEWKTKDEETLQEVLNKKLGE